MENDCDCKAPETEEEVIAFEEKIIAENKEIKRPTKKCKFCNKTIAFKPGQNWSQSIYHKKCLKQINNTPVIGLKK